MALNSIGAEISLVIRVFFSGKMVSRIFASWNQLDGWLRQIEGLRFVA